MASLASSFVALGLLVSLRTRGWRVPAYGAGIGTIIIGLEVVLYPALPSSVGISNGLLIVSWGVVLIILAEWKRVN